eukprot:TRINITY_DN1635_c0_g1_i2.p1 TRINITY_DN1635_c0_g1~~TRINITY_DN1635_c0_g1_i2.p1  ORF type:complete len:363 (+),score=54.38 TRINITY_DN1635_c0_g1_i2:133-1221(+)
MSIPKETRKWVVHKLSNNFSEATKLETVSLPSNPPDGHLIVKNHYLGINASDINWTSGKYAPIQPPFDCGFESLGVVVSVGQGIKGFEVNDPVMVMHYSTFGEYIIVPAQSAFLIPKSVSLSPSLLSILVSGLTASISLEQIGQLPLMDNNKTHASKTVVVTAAAGGTGLIAVQLAKFVGYHVIGTCSDDKKAELLRSVGCDRVVNYRKEDLYKVLKTEYPDGVDVVYESVGGELYEACLNNLAVKGKLIVIGTVSNYKDGSAFANKQGKSEKASRPLPMKLLGKSASISGFLVTHYRKLFKTHFSFLIKLYSEGKLKGILDDKKFVGLESVPNAIDYLYSGKNVGKVYVDLTKEVYIQSKL